MTDGGDGNGDKKEQHGDSGAECDAGLEKELKKGRKPATTGGVRKRSFSLYRGSVQSVAASKNRPTLSGKAI